MHIAIVSTPFLSTPPRDYGGTELVVSELAEGLAAHGHDVTLCATGDSHTAAELRALYPRPHWPPDPLVDLNHVSWSLRQAEQLQVDLVHVNSAAALAVARLCPRLPLV
jgi:nucleoside-diphosphate-sugar epimerase